MVKRDMEKQTKEILILGHEARTQFYEMIQDTKREDLSVRIRRQNYQTQLMFAAPEDIEENDLVQDAGNFNLILDPDTAEALEGARLDFEEGGFQITPAPGKSLYPKTKEWGEPTADAVQTIIDQQLNPGLASHNGWVTLLEVKDDTAYIEMGGGCRGCMHSYMTLKDTIERVIKENVPDITTVTDTTDHAGGTNPYYAPAE
jgi:Fe/S biogenesis protein NfuA